MTKLQNVFITLVDVNIFHMTLKSSLFTRSPKQGHQRPHKWICFQQKFKIKKKFIHFGLLEKFVSQHFCVCRLTECLQIYRLHHMNWY